jgi:hypothetical protein
MKYSEDFMRTPLFFLTLFLLQDRGCNFQNQMGVTSGEMFNAVYEACTAAARTNTPLHDGIPLARDVENCQAGAHAAQRLLQKTEGK